jgi:deoxyribonuclease V
VLVDGQGIAHPRRFGIAAHLGLLLDIPTIGCAKSRLIGEYAEPVNEAGSYTYLKDNKEIIGAVVRTKTNTKPVFVSVGHKVSLDQAVHWVQACCHGYRLPEPTRQAHIQANKQPEPVHV